jgi:hypothetical protein
MLEWVRARPALLIILSIAKLMLCQIQFETKYRLARDIDVLLRSFFLLLIFYIFPRDCNP